MTLLMGKSMIFLFVWSVLFGTVWNISRIRKRMMAEGNRVEHAGNQSHVQEAARVSATNE